MNHQARQFDNKKGTLQRPCSIVSACLAPWPEKGQAVPTTDYPIISNDFYFYAGNRTGQTVTDPLLNVMSYNYNGENNKTRQTDWRGNATTYDYDSKQSGSEHRFL